MRQVRGWLMVVVLCCAAGVAEGMAQPDVRLREARTAFDEANTLWDAGRYAEAIARGEQALALREAVLGGTHPDVAECLDQLGLHFLLQGNPVRAEPLLQRALAIREAALGESHPEVARTLNTLGKLYADQALYGRAEPLHARALAIREASLGENHPLVAESLNQLANLYTAQRLYARAEPLFLRALSLREATLGEDHPEVARTLQGLASLYDLQGLYGRAEPLAQRALAIREATLGKDHPLLSDSLFQLGSLYESMGSHARAEPLAQRALAIREATSGKNTPDVATSLEQLAGNYMNQGLAARAEPLYTRVVAIREETLGKNHPLVAEPLSWLGFFFFEQGLYGQAEPLLERAVAIREASLGENHPLVANVLLDLGGLYVAQGLYARAEPVLQRALAIRKAAFGENSRFVATALLDLGGLYMAQGQYARAEPLLRRGLDIREAILGKNASYVARALTLLGGLYVAQGQYARAEPLLRRAVANHEAALGANNSLVAAPLKSLSDLYAAQGLYGRARPLYERTLAILEANWSEHPPSLAETLNHLAVVHLAQGRLAKALPLLTRAFVLSERRLRQETLGFSEVRLASFLQFLRADEERLYALLRAHPDDVNVRRLALGAALLLKGRSVEESSDISRTVYRSLSEQDRATFERLRGLRTQLAQLSLQGPGSLPLPAYQQRLKELAEQGSALEADLARRSAPLRALAALPPPADIVDRVAAALPRDAALVELLTYVDRPLVPRPGTPKAPRSGQLRYLALVLFPDATIRFRDLGPAEPIDSAASRLRDALANRDAGFQAHAQTLHQLAFQPLLPLLGKTRRLFLSPDGQLALVPFAALHDGQRFLVDAFDFTYLPSGKNLLPRPEEKAPPGSVVVLADPDFGAPRPALPHSQGDAPVQAWRSMANERFFSSPRAALAQRAWAHTPLPGTRQEAEAIQRLLPQAQLFMGAEATKERLLRLPPPGILHLATHGFFLEDAPQLPGSRAVGHFGALGEDRQAPSPPDPLLRSGLVLAGASAPAPSSPAQPWAEHALVTALELAGLDLWGTQLVVLSACDTGRGDIKLGQGVYGLRRAFLVAGAETVVMSLWKVNDETTRQLMEAYYRNLLAGQGRATALREAMSELRRTRPHPHYWAPFLVMGRETPLRLLASSFDGAQHR
jgi:CHAT domain-containing protein/lipopolysaccharide biosynthesis regulator YciM